MNYEEQEKEKKKNWIERNFRKTMMVLVFMLVLSVYIHYENMSNDDDVTITIISQNKPQIDSTLAMRLTLADWQLISQTNCGACDRQKEIFGVYQKDLNILECDIDDNVHECVNIGISFTPTWYHTESGLKVVGFVTLDQFEYLTRIGSCSESGGV